MLDFKTDFTLRGHSAPVNVLRFSPDGKQLASGGEFFISKGVAVTPSLSNVAADNGYIRIWSVQIGKVEQVLLAYQGPVTAVEWVQHSNMLGMISAGADGTLKLWKRSTLTVSHSASSIFGC